MGGGVVRRREVPLVLNCVLYDYLVSCCCCCCLSSFNQIFSSSFFLSFFLSFFFQVPSREEFGGGGGEKNVQKKKTMHAVQGIDAAVSESRKRVEAGRGGSIGRRTNTRVTAGEERGWVGGCGWKEVEWNHCIRVAPAAYPSFRGGGGIGVFCCVGTGE